MQKTQRCTVSILLNLTALPALTEGAYSCISSPLRDTLPSCRVKLEIIGLFLRPPAGMTQHRQNGMIGILRVVSNSSKSYLVMLYSVQPQVFLSREIDVGITFESKRPSWWRAVR